MYIACLDIFMEYQYVMNSAVKHPHLSAGVTAFLDRHSGKMQQAVLALSWHSHLVAVAGQLIVVPIVVVPVL